MNKTRLRKQYPISYMKRRAKRIPDYIRRWMFEGSNFERLNPEE